MFQISFFVYSLSILIVANIVKFGQEADKRFPLEYFTMYSSHISLTFLKQKKNPPKLLDLNLILLYFNNLQIYIYITINLEVN